MILRTLALVFACAGTAAAQIVSFSLLTPAVAQATVNGQVQSTTLPAGSLATSGLVQQLGSGAWVSASWMTFAAPIGVYFDLQTMSSVDPLGSASFTGGEFLLQLSNPTPVAVELQLQRLGTMATASLLVDVGNDGSIELTNASPQAELTLSVTIGPVPLSIRIRNDVTLTAPGFHHAIVAMSAVPVDGIQVTQGVLGCDPGYQQVVLPTFNHEVRLGVSGPLLATQPSVMVLGLSLQPVVLPTVTSFPCLLLPAPDVALFPGSQFVNLSAPAAVRPFTFWAQAVVLHPTELRTTNAMLVQGF